jgi:hypothetical protein
MSPSDLGQVLKPFVFLDLFDMEHATFQGMGLHPHSGIATVSCCRTRAESEVPCLAVAKGAAIRVFRA